MDEFEPRLPVTRPRIGSTEVAATLRRAILDGALRRHDRLPTERELASIHNVSRGTVREAVSRLRRENLVETQRGSGSYVVHRTDDDDSATELFANARPLELVDARFALEPHICRLVVLHGRRTDFGALDELLVCMENSVDDPITFAEADGQFHQALARSTGNALLIWLISKVNLVRHQEEWKRMREATLDRRTIANYNHQHRQIVNAIRAREPERAASLMKEHLETARLSLTRAAAT